MTAKEFIKKELENFIKQFPKTRVRYEFHEMANAHFIEILPNEIYSLDEKYLLWESEMWDRYVELYPQEGICFISDDALVGINNAELILYGEEYMLVPTEFATINFDSIVIFYNQSVLQKIEEITFTEHTTWNNTEETKLPKEYSCQTYPLAA